jgi:hypothetical protein
MGLSSEWMLLHAVLLYHAVHLTDPHINCLYLTGFQVQSYGACNCEMLCPIRCSHVCQQPSTQLTCASHWLPRIGRLQEDDRCPEDRA